MKTVEASGKSLTEAITNGIKTFGVKESEVNYEVISQTEEETKIRLTIKEPRQYLCALTDFVLTSIGFRPNILVTKDDRGFYINIKTKYGDSLLIGKTGETLWALQYLLSRLAKRFYPNIKILVDVNSYRQKRNNFLKKKAEAIALIVLQTGKEMAMDPMTKREEQIVVNKLNEIKGVKMYAIGKGANRNIIIAPVDELH